MLLLASARSARAADQEQEQRNSPGYASYQRANESFATRKFTECGAALDEALQADPRLFPALLLRGRLAMGLNRYDLAKESLRRAVAVQPTSWYAHFLYGFQFHQQSEMPAAVPELLEARRLNPKSALPALYLGLSHETLGHTAEALAFYKEAIHIEDLAGGAQADTLLPLARFLFMQGSYEECGPVIQRALQSNPKSRDAHYEHGRLLLEIGNASEAAAEGEVGLHLPAPGVSDRQIRYLLLRAYRLLGRESDAAAQATALRDVLGERQ